MYLQLEIINFLAFEEYVLDSQCKISFIHQLTALIYYRRNFPRRMQRVIELCNAVHKTHLEDTVRMPHVSSRSSRRYQNNRYCAQVQ